MEDSFWGIVILVALVGFIFYSPHIPNSGQHTGYVSSVEQSGVIWKTWTAYIKTDPQSSQEDSYCVIDPTIVNELKNDSSERNLVTINYSVPMFVGRWQCGGEQSIIQSIPSDGDTSAWPGLPSSVDSENATFVDESKVTITCNYGNRRVINGTDSGIQFTASDFDENGSYTYDLDKNTELQQVCQITPNDLEQVSRDNSTLFTVVLSK